MGENLTVGLTNDQRELLLRGLRYVRSAVLLEMDEPTPEFVAGRTSQPGLRTLLLHGSALAPLRHVHHCVQAPSVSPASSCPASARRARSLGVSISRAAVPPQRRPSTDTGPG